jgi:FlaA1/EpsC-like NDP-sugar epimerase
VLSLSRRQFSAGALTEMVVFAACCISTMMLAVLLHLGPYGVPSQSVLIPAVQFAAIMTALGVIFALFRVGEPKSLTVVFIRTVIVLAVGFPIAYAAFGYAPGGSTARQVLGSASLYALASVVLIRAAVSMVLEAGVGLQRILIVGTGPEAVAVEKVVNAMGPRRSVVVGFYPTGVEEAAGGRPAEGGARLFPRSIELSAIIQRFKVDEVIVAVREQRGGVLPIRE